jgi:hypothetical protein
MISATCRCKELGLITIVTFSLAGFQGLDICYEKEVACILLVKIVEWSRLY